MSSTKLLQDTCHSNTALLPQVEESQEFHQPNLYIRTSVAINVAICKR